VPPRVTTTAVVAAPSASALCACGDAAGHGHQSGRLPCCFQRRQWVGGYSPNAVAVAECALGGGIQYGGQSATFGGDNILRNDVAKVIKQWESAAFLCQNIKAIDAKISDVKRVKGRMQSEEVWTVQACGQVHHYNVRMHEDERGETNFNVSFLK